MMKQIMFLLAVMVSLQVSAQTEVGSQKLSGMQSRRRCPLWIVLGKGCPRSSWLKWGFYGANYNACKPICKNKQKTKTVL